jgi:hypothetical protein
MSALEVATFNGIEVFDQIDIKAERPVYIHNETMTIKLMTEFNLDKILDVEIQCLLNNGTIGNLKVKDKQA